MKDNKTCEECENSKNFPIFSLAFNEMRYKIEGINREQAHTDTRT